MNNKENQGNSDNRDNRIIDKAADDRADNGSTIEDFYLNELLADADVAEEKNSTDKEEQHNSESVTESGKKYDTESCGRASGEKNSEESVAASEAESHEARSDEKNDCVNSEEARSKEEGSSEENTAEEVSEGSSEETSNESAGEDVEAADVSEESSAADGDPADASAPVMGGVSADLQPDDEIPEKEEGVDYGLKNADYYDLDTIVARITQRKKEAKDKKKDKIIRTKLIAGGVAILILLFIFSLTDFFTVDNIVVEGNKYFSAEEIINMGHAAPGKNLIYHCDKGSIHDYLEANPYIKKAKIRRRLPSTIVIKVEERIQAAAIRYEDEYLIIDREGYILRKTRTKPKITIIEGLVIRKMKVGEKIIVKKEALLERSLNLLRLMKEHDLYFVRLNMKGRYIKAYIYESLVCKGTYKQIVSSVEENKLHRVLEEIFDDGISRGTITFSDEGYISFEPAIY